MKSPIRTLWLAIPLLAGCLFAVASPPARPLQGPYLGQPPPGAEPEVFARGIVSDDYQQHGAPTFSPDGREVFWQTNRLDHERKWQISFMTMRRVGNTWTAPEASPYWGLPFFSPDGRRLYLGSRENGDDPSFAEKQANGWSEPKSVGLVTRFPDLQFAYNLSIARNGTLYFLGHAAGLGTKNDYGIFRAELVGGEYAKPELLPRCINLPSSLNWTPFIAPDESCLLFSSNRLDPGRRGGEGCDLYVSRRLANGEWTEPVSLGERINSRGLERFPAFSPDGKYLFFTRDTPGHDEDVYWVDAASVPALHAPPNPPLEQSK